MVDTHPRTMRRVLERLVEAADMMALLAQVIQATERRAEGLADTAERVNDPAAGVPMPIRWG